MNPNVPVFRQSRYDVTVSATTSADRPVVQVDASDADADACLASGVTPCACADIKYTIAYGNEDGAFRIDTKTGELFLVGSVIRETSYR